MTTFGPVFIEKFDGARLRSKQEKVRDFMLASNCRFQTLEEIKSSLEVRFGERFPAPSLSASLRHLRKRRFGSYVLDKRHRGDPSAGLWEYRLFAPPLDVGTQFKLELLSEVRQ